MRCSTEQVPGIGTEARGLVIAKYSTENYKQKTRIKIPSPKQNTLTLSTKMNKKRTKIKIVLLYKYWQTTLCQISTYNQKSKNLAK